MMGIFGSTDKDFDGYHEFMKKKKEEKMKESEKIRNRIKHLVIDYYWKKRKEKQKTEKINYAGRVYSSEELTNLVDSSLDFWLTHGEYCNEFEKKFSEFLGVRHSYFVNSGSSANLLAFMTLTSPLLEERKIERGDEVITVACGFPTTVSPIIQYGAVPVFVDIDIETLNIDVNGMKKALSNKTKAVMIAHTLGNPFNVDAVRKFCDENALWLIEDNCDALGSKYDRQYTGTFGDIATSSFYPPHHITTGEGGMVYTNNPLLGKIIKSMRDWGRDCSCESGQDDKCGKRFEGQYGTLPEGYDHKYVYSHFGYNLKATEMQASIGSAQLEKLPDFINKRKNNFEFLYSLLEKYDDKIFILPVQEWKSDPSPFGFWMTLTDDCNFSRNDITKYLEDNNIQTRNVFAGNIIKHPCFIGLQEAWDYRVVGNLENTNKVMNDTFWIGVYPGLSIEDLEFMVDKIKEFVGKF